MNGRIEHEYHDAILMSMSALAVMATYRYSVWRNYARLATDPRFESDKEFHEQYRDESAAVLKRLCELVDEAMQYIGDANSNVDLVDEHGMTDAAFAALDRALRPACPTPEPTP